MYKIYLADRRKIYFIDDSNFGSHKCIERGKFKHFGLIVIQDSIPAILDKCKS